MALRRGIQLLGPRLFSGQQRCLQSAASLPAFGQDDAAPCGHTSSCSCGKAAERAYSSFAPAGVKDCGHVGLCSCRGYSTSIATPPVTYAPTPSGLPPTVHAMKHPSPAIEYDEYQHERFAPGDPSKRAFTYFVLTGGRFIYASAIRLAVLKFLVSMTASKDVLAMASLEVELGKIEPGQTITVKWRGKPVFIRRRTEDDVKLANSVDVHSLRDPQPDSDRVQNPEWLVLVGVCTHLGCVPLANAGDYGGWFCPCHGSHYDISGRIRKGPAPYNLEVPTYKFLDENTLIVG